MKTSGYYILFALLAFVCAGQLSAQPRLEKDYSFVMEIPSVITMVSSPAHVYVLSDTEGMVVFRTHTDTLQWLYSSPDMERRGNTATADIRFAYLFGDSHRLTVLEPTSILGVYSAALLPAIPLDAKRIDQYLYVALGSKGLGQLSLHTPASVDSTVDLIKHSKLRNEFIIDLETSPSQLFALSANKKLFVFKRTEDKLALSRELPLPRELDHIFLVENTLLGSDEEGNIYEIDNSGNLSRLGSINESVKKIQAWRDWLLIQGASNRVWTSYRDRTPVLWKDDPKAGNFFTVTQGQLWLSEYDHISRIIPSRQPDKPVARQYSSDASGTIKLKPIKDQVIPFPKPLLLSVELEAGYPPDQVQFAYQSDVRSARIRGNGFYWQPEVGDVGRHHFKIIATASNGQTDSTIFSVDVRSFNAPPRFIPLRAMSIPAGQSFTLPVRALDPDGMNQDLVRYLGVNLPEGATVNEQTGEFSWTPTLRHIGSNEFRIIATDQYGAAASTNVTIRVIESPRAEGEN